MYLPIYKSLTRDYSSEHEPLTAKQLFERWNAFYSRARSLRGLKRISINRADSVEKCWYWRRHQSDEAKRQRGYKHVEGFWIRPSESMRDTIVRDQHSPILPALWPFRENDDVNCPPPISAEERERYGAV